MRKVIRDFLSAIYGLAIFMFGTIAALVIFALITTRYDEHVVASTIAFAFTLATLVVVLVSSKPFCEAVAEAWAQMRADVRHERRKSHDRKIPFFRLPHSKM